MQLSTLPSSVRYNLKLNPFKASLQSSSVQVQANLAGSIERADLNEQALAKARARGRSASMGPL